jgi:hypothetical protein
VKKGSSETDPKKPGRLSRLKEVLGVVSFEDNIGRNQFVLGEGGSTDPSIVHRRAVTGVDLDRLAR